MSSAVLLLSIDSAPAFAPPVLDRLHTVCRRLDVIGPITDWRAGSAALSAAEVLFTGWGAPRMDEEFLRRAPNLRAVFYAGGSVRYFVTDAFWRTGARLSTAQAINAIPVAEYTSSMLQLGLKRVWHYARLTRELRTFPTDRPLMGAYGSTIGLISYGTIARLVRERLRSLDCAVMVYDPFLSADEAEAEGVERVDLDELFRRADAVSVHAPSLPETRNLIRGEHLAAMKPDAFFLNTSRGEVVHESELIAVLQRRPDLQAVLDVTYPEPPPPDSSLYRLPNVVLTPHIAGSIGRECHRMGHAMIDEYERYQAGQPLRWEIDSARAALLA